MAASSKDVAIELSGCDGAAAAAGVAWHAVATPEEVMQRLGTSADGLSPEEAARRLHFHGPNRLTPPAKPGKTRTTHAAAAPAAYFNLLSLYLFKKDDAPRGATEVA